MWPSGTPWRRPHPDAQIFQADLRAIEESLQEKHGGALVEQRLRRRIRAVEMFGFYLVTVELRQSYDKHAVVVTAMRQHMYAQ